MLIQNNLKKKLQTEVHWDYLHHEEVANNGRKKKPEPIKESKKKVEDKDRKKKPLCSAASIAGHMSLGFL